MTDSTAISIYPTQAQPPMNMVSMAKGTCPGRNSTAFIVYVLLTAGVMSDATAVPHLYCSCDSLDDALHPVGTIFTSAGHKVQLPVTASTRLPCAARGHAAVAHRQLAQVHRRTHGATQRQPMAAAGFVQELGVMYRYNDIPQGLSRNSTAEACATACRGIKSATCIAWSWLPASSAAHASTCSLKSARGTVIETSPGAVSGYLTGEALVHRACSAIACACLPASWPASVNASNDTCLCALPCRPHDHSTVACIPGTMPYALGPGSYFHGHVIANATVNSLEDCATACTAFQGSKSHSRCSAWTWRSGDANRPSSCKLKSFKGRTKQVDHAGVVSGYLEGGPPCQGACAA
jgi:hypothetical protein